MYAEQDELEILHDRVPRDFKVFQVWQNSIHKDPEPAPTLEFSNASEEYLQYMEELTKWWPPSSGWYNWYSERQTMVYRRWSTFDLALGNWVLGFTGSLKQQLEAAKFCEHVVIDPTPHYRFLRLRYTRDVLRPNLALNRKGLGEYSGYVAQDLPVECPVMVFQVATRETLDAARSDMWRYLWESDRCRVGIIFIVNSFYDQCSKPFKLSMEIWSHQPTDLEYPYPLDYCPLPTSQLSFSYPPKQNENRVRREPVDSSEPVDLKPVLKRNADGLLTFRPAEDEVAIVMRHRKEIVVIDETRAETDLLKYVTFWATDFIPLCSAQLNQDVTIKPVRSTVCGGVSAAIVTHPHLPPALLTVIEKGKFSSEWQKDIAILLNQLLFWICSNNQRGNANPLICINDIITRLEAVSAAVTQYDEFRLAATSVLHTALVLSGIHHDAPDVFIETLGLLARYLNLGIEMAPNQKGELVPILRKATLLYLQRYNGSGLKEDIDTALDYFGRLLSLDPSEAFGDLSQLLAIGENQNLRFRGQYNPPDYLITA